MQRRQVPPLQLQVSNNTSSQQPSTGQINNSNLLPIHSSNTTTNALSVLGGLTVDKSRLKNRKSRLIHLGNAGTKQELLTEFDQICEELTIDPKIESFQILSAIRQVRGPVLTQIVRRDENARWLDEGNRPETENYLRECCHERHLCVAPFLG
jgi:hypothetical protein